MTDVLPMFHTVFHTCQLGKPCICLYTVLENHIVHITGTMGRQLLTTGTQELFYSCASRTVEDKVDCILAWRSVEKAMGSFILHVNDVHRAWEKRTPLKYRHFSPVP